MKLLDLFDTKNLLLDTTISSATDSHGNVSRQKSDKIADPNGYFAKNKKQLKKQGKWLFKSAK